MLFEANKLGGWCQSGYDENVQGVPMELGARMLLNDDAAKEFYEMAHLAGEVENLIGSSPACRESFLADCAVDDP